jgi:uncharacterized repeat protein (TIGR01451 family)
VAESTSEKKDDAAAIQLEMRTGRQEPSVSIEWIGPQTARLNTAMPFQVLVRNTCAFSVQNVVARHRLPKGVTCKGSDPQATTEGDTLVWDLGTLPAGQVKKIDLLLVSATRGPINCQAQVTFTGTSTHQVVVREPQLIVKMKAPAKVISGETVTLLFAVSNPGDGSADQVKLKVGLPEGLEHTRGRLLDIDIGSLGPKEIRTMQLVCIAKGAGPQKCAVVAVGDGNLSSGDSAQLEILLPKLDLVMSGPKLRYIDRKANYVMKVTNPGSAPANNVALREVVPAGFKFQAASPGGVYDEGSRTVSWVLGDLQPGQAREVAVELVPTAPGDHRLAALVTTSRGLKTEAALQTHVEGLSAINVEVADTDDPVEVGAETAYEIRVANEGTKTETNVEVVCSLPEQMEFRAVKAGANLRYRLEGRDIVFEPISKLAPKADVIFRVQVRGRLAGDVRFRTRVRAEGMTEPILREERTRLYNDNVPAR